MSNWGKLVGGLTMFTGLLVVAFPITILSMNMTELYEEYRAKSSVKQLVQEQKLQNILHLQEGVYNQPSILLPEQIELLKILMEDLVRTEVHANKLSNNIEQAIEQITDVKNALGSFSGNEVQALAMEEEYKIVDSDADIGISTKPDVVDALPKTIKFNPFLDE